MKTQKLFVIEGFVITASSKKKAKAKAEKSRHLYCNAMDKYNALYPEESECVQDVIKKHVDNEVKASLEGVHYPYTLEENAFLNSYNIENYFCKDHKAPYLWKDMSNKAKGEFNTVEELYEAYILASAAAILRRQRN